MSLELEFLNDPAAFLEAAGEHLAREPVLTTVVSTLADRAVGEIADGITQPAHDWWLVVHDGGAVVGAGMRTARTEPRPAYLLPMPDEAARLLATQLHRRGEALGGVNGALPAARVCADEAARRSGGRVEVSQHTRLFAMGEPVPARAVPGRLRPATRGDVELVHAWHEAFMGDADEQAGRARGTTFMRRPRPRTSDAGSTRGVSGCGSMPPINRSTSPASTRRASASPGSGRSTPRPRSAGGAGPALRSPRCRSGCGTGEFVPACSPIRPTRPPTGSTWRWATGRSSTWCPCSSGPDRWCTEDATDTVRN